MPKSADEFTPVAFLPSAEECKYQAAQARHQAAAALKVAEEWDAMATKASAKAKQPDRAPRKARTTKAAPKAAPKAAAKRGRGK